MSRNGKAKSDATLHLLGVRVSSATMKKLDAHCKRKGSREQRRVSYREVVEELIGTLR